MKQIDSIQPPSRSNPSPHQVSASARQGTGARFTAFKSTSKRRIAWEIVLTTVLSPLLFGLALLGTIGMGVLVLYGIVAWVRKLPSRTTFILALAALLYMVILQLAAMQVFAQSMAALAYILLAIGVISLALEVKMSRRLWFKKH